MSVFLVEVYVAPATGPSSTPQYEDVSAAAEALTRAGTHVRLLRSILVPEDETCFYLFQAETSQAVRDVAARAGLPLERVAEAVVLDNEQLRTAQATQAGRRKQPSQTNKESSQP